MTTAIWEDDNEAIDFLNARGYVLIKSYDWIPPPREPTDMERCAARYLFEEWDFGGILPGNYGSRIRIVMNAQATHLTHSFAPDEILIAGLKRSLELVRFIEPSE